MKERRVIANKVFVIENCLNPTKTIVKAIFDQIRQIIYGKRNFKKETKNLFEEGY